jgi:HK97 family phage portal protein
MGVLDRVNAAYAEARSSPAEQRAIAGVPWRPWDSPWTRFDVGGPLHPSRQYGAGGVDGALRLQPVYSSVRLLAEGVAMLPIHQFRDLGDRAAKMPLGQLLSKPSAFINRFDWLFQYVSSAGLQGTAPGLITARDGYGYPTTIEWLPPEDFHAEDSKPWNPARTRFYFAGRQIARENLLLVNAFTIPGRTLGISPLRYFQLLIESGVDALSYGADWYKSGGFPPGTFQNTQYEVDEEQSAAIRRKLVAAQRNREPLVYGRDWEYKPVSVPPNEAQFVQAMQLNATQIAGIFGVPPYRVGGTRGDSMTYSNVESENLGFVTDSLDPWLVRLETALADCLPQAQYAEFNRNARLRMTPETRWTVYRAARDIGGMNVDEVRALEGMDPLPRPKDADDYDGQDFTPLQIQVAAARGIKEIIGEGTGGAGDSGGVETNPQAAKQAPAPKVPAGSPAPVPAANGHGKPRG